MAVVLHDFLPKNVTQRSVDLNELHLVLLVNAFHHRLTNLVLHPQRQILLHVAFQCNLLVSQGIMSCVDSLHLKENVSPIGNIVSFFDFTIQKFGQFILMYIHSVCMLIRPLIGCLYITLTFLESWFYAAQVLCVHGDLLLQRGCRLCVNGPGFFDLVVHCYVVISDKCLQFLVVFLQTKYLVSYDEAPLDVLVMQKHGVIDFFDLFIDFVVHLLALLFHVDFINLYLLLHLFEKSLLFVN